MILFECKSKIAILFHLIDLRVSSYSIEIFFSITDCDRYTLYAGRFIACDSILFNDIKSNKLLRTLMQKKRIDDLFIDATTAHIYESNLKYDACQEIESLIKWVDAVYVLHSRTSR